MKNLLILLFFSILLFSGIKSNAQGTQIYTTSGGEMIFSFASIKYEQNEHSSVMRWSPVINLQGMLNFDFSDHIGLFTGLAIRNVGFIMDQYKDPVTDKQYKKIFRTYNGAIPVGIKLGNMKRAFLYGGIEFELPFLYKEKTFEGTSRSNKLKTQTYWFTERVNTMQQAVFFGIQLPYGGNLKFKYYLTKLLNNDFKETLDGVEIKPYQYLDANIFYFSLNLNLFKNASFIHGSTGKKNKEGDMSFNSK